MQSVLLIYLVLASERHSRYTYARAAAASWGARARPTSYNSHNYSLRRNSGSNRAVIFHVGEIKPIQIMASD